MGDEDQQKAIERTGGSLGLITRVAGQLAVNSWAAPTVAALATSWYRVPAFAVTYRWLTASRLTVPSALCTNRNRSHVPTAPRLATSGERPAFSAVTYRPLTPARSATYPPPRSISVNLSQLPAALRLATSGPRPPRSALTYRLSLRAFSVTVVGGASGGTADRYGPVSALTAATGAGSES